MFEFILSLCYIIVQKFLVLEELPEILAMLRAAAEKKGYNNLFKFAMICVLIYCICKR